jgi:hypothetical protein
MQFTLYQGGRVMRTGGLFLPAALMLTVILVMSGAASAFSDAMPHYGNGGCASHMVNPTHTTAAPYIFYVCQGTSGATYWTTYLTNRVTGVKLAGCGFTNQQVPAQGYATFNCTVPAGTYTATISYTVPGNSFVHLDAYYISP